ncbi:MAG: hypothetical protein N2255_07165, partial [Kiritimatiellae bacterium]|nr:hypothetical protein [Kiritimatiellia bacterium]
DVYKRQAHCPCGRPGPVIKTVCGRIGDYILTADGRMCPDVALIAEKLHNVSRIQVVQEEPRGIIVRIVPVTEFSAADEKHLRRCFEERLGKETEIRVEVVEDLERAPNGKVFSIINRIAGLSLHR